jgi:hypothetical protein
VRVWPVAEPLDDRPDQIACVKHKIASEQRRTPRRTSVRTVRFGDSQRAIETQSHFTPIRARSSQPSPVSGRVVAGTSMGTSGQSSSGVTSELTPNLTYGRSFSVDLGIRSAR